MSLPLNIVTTAPVQSDFLPPGDLPYTPLSETVLGGVAIGDGGDGRQIQLWTVTYNGNLIQVTPESGVVAFSLAVAGVLAVSLAFDSNMQVTLAYQTALGSNLYYFDSSLGRFTTLSIADSTSCRVAVDDARAFNNAASDVIFAYTLDGECLYRQQRDRYAIERLIGVLVNPLSILQRVGVNSGNRLQFKLAK